MSRFMVGCNHGQGNLNGHQDTTPPILISTPLTSNDDHSHPCISTSLSTFRISNIVKVRRIVIVVLLITG